LLNEALIAEAKSWKFLYGSLANRKYKNRMKEIFELVGTCTSSSAGAGASS
jgi:hypothetical protein